MCGNGAGAPGTSSHRTGRPGRRQRVDVEDEQHELGQVGVEATPARPAAGPSCWHAGSPRRRASGRGRRRHSSPAAGRGPVVRQRGVQDPAHQPRPALGREQVEPVQRDQHERVGPGQRGDVAGPAGRVDLLRDRTAAAARARRTRPASSVAACASPALGRGDAGTGRSPGSTRRRRGGGQAAPGDSPPAGCRSAGRGRARRLDRAGERAVDVRREQEGHRRVRARPPA